MDTTVASRGWVGVGVCTCRWTSPQDDLVALSVMSGWTIISLWYMTLHQTMTIDSIPEWLYVKLILNEHLRKQFTKLTQQLGRKKLCNNWRQLKTFVLSLGTERIEQSFLLKFWVSADRVLSVQYYQFSPSYHKILLKRETIPKR